jgi:hypothetical protein
LRTRQQRSGKPPAAIGQTVVRPDHSLAGNLPKPHFNEAAPHCAGCGLTLPVMQHDLAAGAGVDAEMADDAELLAGEQPRIWRVVLHAAAFCMR